MKNLLFSFAAFFLYFSSYAAEWQTFSFTSARGAVYYASSELDKPTGFSFGKYGPHNLFDRNPATAWVEGEDGSGTGHYICIGAGQDLLPYIVLANGYQKNHDLFLKNNRVKNLKLTLYIALTDEMRVTQAGFEADAVAFPEKWIINLKDVEGYQTFPLPFDTADVIKYRHEKIKEYISSHREDFSGTKAPGVLQDFFFFKFEIVSVYPGSKWDDTCLSDLLFTNKENPSFIPANEKILSVHESENEGAILVRTSGRVYELFSITNDEVREGKVLSVASVSPDRQWAVIDIMTGGVGRSTEETYHLYYLPLLTEVPHSLIDHYGLGEPMDFEEKESILYVVFFDGQKEAAEIREDMRSLRRSSFFHKNTVAKE
jgi:hypothetical protein